MSNRLAAATSPYLLQHKDNPVDWYEWGEAAFVEARRRDVPVLLSVGYAACHWCHVMAHESFEDDATAAQMNAGFVNVKVDREERPDVDAVYMQVTTALTGAGGWPMTVVLTPDGKPFYAGTYFPPVSLQGRPSLRQVLAAISEAWTGQREQIESSGAQIAAEVGRRAVPAGAGVPTAEQLVEAVRALERAEDRAHGGFGGAPKFPPSMVLEFLLRHAASVHGSAAGTAGTAQEVAARCLTAMAHSGTYDQLAGGFARYSVDAGWVVPHFEKMLYDNAQLARVYLHWWRLTGAETGRRVAEETCDWMITGLGTPEGAFASSLDADTVVQDDEGRSHGVEGATYVWTPDQLVDLLGKDDGTWAAEALAVAATGTFEHGASTVQLTRDLWAEPQSAARWHRVRAAMLAHRGTRPQPGRDDKVVLAWNGLAVAALAETGALCGRDDLVQAAVRCAELLVSVHRDAGGRWRRVSRDGVPGSPAAVLEDLGDLAEGLLALSAVTGERRWTQVVGEVLEQVLDEYADPAGGFFDTGHRTTDAELTVVGRPADPSDNAYPSGTSAASGALLGWAALTGSARHRAAAEGALAAAGALAGPAPRFAGWGLAVAEAALDGPREVAVLGPRSDDRTRALHLTALWGTAPGLVVAMGEPADGDAVPLLAGRSTVGGAPAAYVCRDFVCALPTTDPEMLAGQVLVTRAGGRVRAGVQAREPQIEVPAEP